MKSWVGDGTTASVGLGAGVVFARSSFLPQPDRATRALPAPVALAADLPAPFGYRPTGVDRAAILREVADVVKQQATELGVDACYLQKIPGVVQRIEDVQLGAERPFEQRERERRPGDGRHAQRAPRRLREPRDTLCRAD